MEKYDCQYYSAKWVLHDLDIENIQKYEMFALFTLNSM